MPPAARLVRPDPAPQAGVLLDAAQQRVVEHRDGPLRVLAGPGTGKTTTLVETAAARIEAGADPESVLVLTFSRRAAAELRVRIAARIGRTVREPLARTFHSYAYGLLRRAAALRGDPPPRLLAAPEQDAVIRELLAGQAEGEGRVRWPEAYLPALGTRGFAAELRDLMLRALERGVSPARLAAWGRQRGRPDWVSAAHFLQEYLDVTALAASHESALDPAELIRAAVDLFHGEPRTLAAERDRRRLVLVDEYQDTDPAQEELLALLAGGGRDLIVVGDPDQSIYAFRGTSPRGLLDFPERFPRADGGPAPTVALTVCRRTGPTLLAASRRVIAHVSGPRFAEHRDLVPAGPPDAAGRIVDRFADRDGQRDGGERDGGERDGGDPDGGERDGGERDGGDPDGAAVSVHVLASANQEAAYIAHRLREAHLRRDIPWSRMAVLVRSTQRRLSVLRRALSTAGVPLSVSGEEVPLAEQPAVRALLDVLAAALPGPGGGWPPDLDEALALALVRSPLGGADALALRRLRQALRRLGDGDAPIPVRLVEVLRQPGELVTVPDPVAAPALRVARLLTVARREAALEGATAESVLWAVWQATGLGPRWQRASRGAGPAAAGAHRDLDAVVALFDAVATFVDRTPASGPRAFLDHVRDQQIPGDTLAARAPSGEAVRILTAHASKGLEWDLVVVAGVQEGQWPDLRVRGSLLGSEQLVDLVAGHDPRTVSPVAALRDEEWRLFYVALTRARRQVVVTAVDSPDGDVPSRLLDAVDQRTLADGVRPHTPVPRALSLPAVVAELRAAAEGPGAARRGEAVAGLRRLAAAEVPGAEPDSWWGARPVSDDGALRRPGEQVVVSPSKVERFSTCGLQWLLETAGGSRPPEAGQSLGTLVHEVAMLALDAGVDLDTLMKRLDQSWAELDFGGPWYSRHQHETARAMLVRLRTWLADNPRELVAVEREFDVEVGRARLRGRVDRLERDAEGRLVVVDLKTGSSPPREDDLAGHPQLGAYQAAVEHGAFGPADSGGAELLYVRNNAKARKQHALAATADPQWADRLIADVAEGMAAATFVATENKLCRMCPVIASCPLHARGRQVTG